MRAKISSLLTLAVISAMLSSCGTVQFKESFVTDKERDWLFAQGSTDKPYISKSNAEFVFPLKQLWKFDAASSFGKEALSLADGVLFAQALSGDMYTIDIVTGKGLGRIDLGNSSFTAPIITNTGFVNALTGDSPLSAYNTNRGDIQWERSFGNIECSPIPVNNGIITASTTGSILKVNQETGSTIWRLRLKNSIFRTTPLINDSVAYFPSSSDKTLYAIDINAGKKIWGFKADGFLNSTPMLSDGKLYFGCDDGNLYIIDTAGTLIKKIDLKTKFLSAPIMYQDNVIIPAVDGFIYCISLKTGEVKWKFETKGAISANPILHKDKIFIGSYDKNMYCISANDGSLVWKFATENRIRTTVLVWQDYLIFASDDNQIYCFK